MTEMRRPWPRRFGVPALVTETFFTRRWARALELASFLTSAFITGERGALLKAGTCRSITVDRDAAAESAAASRHIAPGRRSLAEHENASCNRIMLSRLWPNRGGANRKYSLWLAAMWMP